MRPMGFSTVLDPDAPSEGVADPVVETSGQARPVLGSVKVTPRGGRAQPDRSGDAIDREPDKHRHDECELKAAPALIARP
jgi:hypothetical protein